MKIILFIGILLAIFVSVVNSQTKPVDPVVTKIYDVQELIMEIPNFSMNTDLQGNNNDNGNAGRFNQYMSNGSFSPGNLGNFSNNQSFTMGLTPNSFNLPKSRTNEDRLNDLIKMIETVIEPDIWDNKDNKIIGYEGFLIIRAPESVQEEIGGNFK